MTNKELQALLAGCPDDAEVKVADWNEDYTSPCGVTCICYYKGDNSIVIEEVVR